MTKITLCLLTLLPFALCHANEDWFPSRYGETDTLGAANNLSIERTLLAADLIKLGKVQSLAIDTQPDTPTQKPRWLFSGLVSVD